MGGLLSKLDAAGQRAYVAFKLNPDPTTFRNFMQRSGAMLGAVEARPDLSESKPAAPPPPLTTLGAAWKKASVSTDLETRKQKTALRDQMTARIKSGDWNRLSPEEKKALSPILAEMYRPKAEPHLGAGA